MAKRWQRAVLVGVGFLASFWAGAVVGNRWTFSWMQEHLVTEIHGVLNFHLEALAALRRDEPQRAIRVLESMIDPAVSSLPQRHVRDELPKGVRHTLVVAKKYRERFPAERPSAYSAAK